MKSSDQYENLKVLKPSPSEVVDENTKLIKILNSRKDLQKINGTMLDTSLNYSNIGLVS